MPILPLGIEQEAELLVYAVCAGTLVNNSFSERSERGSFGFVTGSQTPGDGSGLGGYCQTADTLTGSRGGRWPPCGGPGDQGAGAPPLPPGVLSSPAPLSGTCGLGGVPSGGHAASYRP